MPNEVSSHAQEYGFGGSFFEDELFDTDDEDDDDNVDPLSKPKWDGAVSETKTRITAFQKGAGRPAVHGCPGWLLNGFSGGGLPRSPG